MGGRRLKMCKYWDTKKKVVGDEPDKYREKIPMRYKITQNGHVVWASKEEYNKWIKGK